MTAVSQKKYTLEEYLDFEWDAFGRHYFCDGAVRPMPYASENKATISVNTLAAFANAAEDADYRTYVNGRMLFIPALNINFYPNLMIIKGEPAFYQLNQRMNANQNPCALLEVEEEFDFNKWSWYREIPSLQQYFMISQTQVYIDIYNRVGNSNIWENTCVKNLEQSIRIAEFDILVKKIYGEVVFPETAELFADELIFET